MALLCLANDLTDLKKRINSITLGFKFDDTPVTVADLGGADAVAILLKDALKPNLVQTLEGTPAILHGGPFANIAHGCNSVIATKTAIALADFVITEAGFGADLGAEKFFDIKCRAAGFQPDCTVLVATVRSLKYNGAGEDTAALSRGLVNLTAHIKNLTTVFGQKVVVAVNKFVSDTADEIALIKRAVAAEGAGYAVCEAWEFGGAGAEELAKTVEKCCAERGERLRFAYNLDMPVADKIRAVADKIYGAAAVVFSDKAKASIDAMQKNGLGNLPVCIAKTQYSFSDDPKKLGRPSGFNLTINEITPRTGAGFIVAQAGNMLLMPGLSKIPAALKMTIDEKGKIDGLF
jgi:formate--tetrahydrofolate ligase